MNEPIDVTSSVSSAVALREEQTQPQQPQQPGSIQRFDARDRSTAIEAVLNRAAVVREVMEKVMKPDIHYGSIPGTNDKKVLLKAGAEKLSAVFRLIPRFTIYQTDYQHFHREYRVTCHLSDGTEGVGTCTTLEEKYRYRKGTRKCPNCGKETIIEGKAEFGGGWLCWAKKGGCGSKFDKSDAAITGQKTEKVEHSNPADYWNTCLKMSKKRAHVDAIITATATSDLLTQDLEEITDLADEASGAAAAEKEPAKKKEPKEPKKPAGKSAVPDELPQSELKRTMEWLEAGKKAFVKKMSDDPVALPFAWLWAVQAGHILPTERLDDIPAERLFKTCKVNVMVDANKPFMRADYDESQKAILELAKRGPMDEKTQTEFNIAYTEPDPAPVKPAEPKKKEAAVKEKPVEVPRDPEAAWKSIPVPAWSKHNKQSGFKTFGELPKNLLWWWACSWKPTGYQNNPPTESDLKLRAILDTVKEQYDFESREDAGSEPGSAQPAKPEPSAPVEDDVPF
jgi:ssDNA-binding Zn-finger/Zn-ribbon topoisomerase 1